MYPESIDAFTPVVPRTPASRLIRSYLKTILSNPESRKIFYFLMLNLCYMLVQMLYGVWTNSLGLISDAIHMAFDCMAIGMGLFASVMATWEPNERFTYGYGRIETLSGFANGIFLILISIFIMFEAIQRILEPPEMNTSQLLLVSSLGLGVNLFGMFAMGGHHHHTTQVTVMEATVMNPYHYHQPRPHSHSLPPPPSPRAPNSGRIYSHTMSSPTYEHAPPNPVTHTHGLSPPSSANSHSHSHSHSHATENHPAENCDDHSHSHSHSHSPGHEHGHEHEHEHGRSHDHGHSHGHGPEHRQGHEDEHGHSHSHSHSHSPTVDHDHNHSHSHSHPQHETSSAAAPPSRPADHSRTMSTSSVSERPMVGNSHAQRRHSRGPSISVDLAPQLDNPSQYLMVSPPSSTITPLTPSYTFGHDDHYDKHHDSHHAPNAHAPSHATAHEGHSHNMRGVFLHVMADTLGSVGVIVSTLLIQFYGWTGFDPIASLFIAILIAASVVPLVMDTGKVLALDVADRETDIQRALSELSTIEGLASYSYPRFWPKDSSSLIGSIHVQLVPSASGFDPHGPHSSRGTPTYTKADRVVERVDALLRGKISGLEELTIQIEGASVLY
ncbi:LOW QUALITY PROTEIN: hypothetical protein CVT25_009375 [Psilocybe cyanescens]|uniref:Cation efflux protein transmembrane domain-containing protein n=1 Tax=Psilocybe cyanescens TaxID=93625 RepID=A0A409XVE3_PSICY|nr:LOW QUALITY PROTEIN: hypothetical protein CVT25_009375 [Psilocybe cyanescens]